MHKLNPNAQPFNPTDNTTASVQLLPHHSPSPIFPQTFFFYPSPYITPPVNPCSHDLHCYSPAPPLPQPISPYPQESNRLGDPNHQTAPVVSVSSRFVAGKPPVSRNSQKGPSSSVFWTPKVSSGDKKTIAASPPLDFEFRETALGKTTVMLKNIPNKYRVDSKQEMLDLLDEHCRKENIKILEEGSPVHTLFSEYDFLYLPMDFINLGYAFINFTSTVAASRLYKERHKKPWNIHGSGKVSEVTHAKIQGADALLKHFKGSSFTCCSAEYLEVIWVQKIKAYNLL